MAKELRCGDVMEGCAYVVRAETEDEVMQKGAQHAKEVHGLDELTPEIVQQVKAAIRNV